MTAERCEPPEGLRERDGWHWLEHQRRSQQMPWRWSRQTWEHFSPEWGYQDGWRYVGPCLTPPEVAALTADRDAAALLADKLQPFADAYEANKFSSFYADMMMSVSPQHWSDAAATLAAYRAAERDAARQKLDGIANVLGCMTRAADLEDAICTMGGELEEARGQAEALARTGEAIFRIAHRKTDEFDAFGAALAAYRASTEPSPS